LSAGFNVLHENLRFKSDSNDPIGLTAAGDDPHHQFSARSSMKITNAVDFDFGLREVAQLPNPAVPGYVSVDARVGWRFLEGAELSVSATNLFDDRHQEFGSLPLQFGGAPLRDIGRSVFVSLAKRF
jgi:iron complex outermembrane receptor protein